MAGGPNAAFVMCIQCTGRAVRIGEGLEDDLYVCPECQGRFGIHWDEGPPTTPRWPPPPDELASARDALERLGRYVEGKSTPLTRSARAVDKRRWHPCDQCGERIPMARDTRRVDDGSVIEAGPSTYVCPFCRHAQAGAATRTWEARKQAACHVCATPLGASEQCPGCRTPRTWMNVSCPYCHEEQPVHAPHWAIDCDLLRFECVHCNLEHLSLCIC